MDQNFRKRLQKTLYCGELQAEECPEALTELAVEYFQDLAPRRLDFLDVQSASDITSQKTVSPSSVAMSMVYAKRLQRKRPDYISKMSSSDLFIISMMMASKYLYDEGVDEEVFNDKWAENAGRDTDEVNSMEMDFLDALDWELFIKKEDFDQAMLSIEKSVALREGLKRGWFTYTDLHLLLDNSWLQLSGTDIGLEWLQVVVVSSAAYFAGIVTMVGSTILVSSACVGLSSSGLLLPVLRPQLHTSPATLPAGVPSLCPQSMVHCRLEASPPDTSFHTNETGQQVEEEEESRSEDQPRMPGQSLVDTILSQLMAVLALKSPLVQFVYAVSDSCASDRDKNHSERKTPHYNPGCCFETEEKGELDDPEASTTDAMMLCLYEMVEASTELDCFGGSCMKCGKQKTNPGLVFMLNLGCSQHCPRCECWKSYGLGEEWMSGITDKLSDEICYMYLDTVKTRSGECCKIQAMASMQSLFPDIAIGFSTSMPPPVYAT